MFFKLGKKCILGYLAKKVVKMGNFKNGKWTFYSLSYLNIDRYRYQNTSFFGKKGL